MIDEDFWWGFIVGILCVATLLKALGVITLSWWIILSPIYVPIAIMLAAIVFFFVVIPVVANLLK